MCILSGTTCLLGGSPSCGSDCSGAPMLPLLYIACNLGFNIAALNLLKTAGVFLLPARQCHMLCICTALAEGCLCDTIYKPHDHATHTSSAGASQLCVHGNPNVACMTFAVCCFACIAFHKAVGTLSTKGSRAYKRCEPAGNVVQTLVMSSLVPTTIFAFTLSLPYLPPAPSLGPNFWLGTAVLVAGLFTFNSPQWRPMLQKKLQSKAA